MLNASSSYEVMPELKNIVGSDEMKNSGGSAGRPPSSLWRRRQSSRNPWIFEMQIRIHRTIVNMQKQPPTLEKCSSAVTKPPIIYPPWSDLPLYYMMVYYFEFIKCGKN